MTTNTLPDVQFGDKVTRYVIAVGVLILVLAVIGVTIGVVRTRKASRVTREWLDYVVAGDYTRAHAMLTPDLRQRIDLDQFRAAVSKNLDLRGFKRLRSKSCDKEDDALVFNASIETDAGKREIQFRWIREATPEGEQLRLGNIVFQGVSVLAGGGTE